MSSDGAAGRLAVYSERELVRAGDWHVPILNPFWGHGAAPMNRPDFADRFVARAGELFTLVDLPDADLAVFPVDWKRVRTSPERIEEARAFAERARAAGVPTAIFSVSDHDEPVPIEDAFVFRTSLTRSRRGEREFALPGLHEDLLDGGVEVREYAKPPIVSFCGFVFFEDRAASLSARLRRAAAEGKRWALERLGRPSERDVYVRARAVEALLHERRFVRPELVLRSQGGGGGQSDPVGDAFRPWEDVRREYVRSIVESDYVLCTRGIGNWSYRLYETLCLGRIPVFVDTDCVLPYDFELDWREHVVWVDRRDVGRIGEIVAAFHERLGADGFAARQRAARRLWEERLSPEGFFANFHRHFPARMAASRAAALAH
jgi:hypothetical protein